MKLYLAYGLSLIAYYAAYGQLVREAESGFDLTTVGGGLKALSEDTLYIFWFVHALSPFWGGVWWFVLLLPAFAGYKLWTGFIAPMRAMSASNDAPETEEERAHREKKERKQAARRQQGMRFK